MGDLVPVYVDRDLLVVGWERTGGWELGEKAILRRRSSQPKSMKEVLFQQLGSLTVCLADAGPG